MNIWTPITSALPPENVVVLAINSEGIEELMSRKGALWFRVNEEMCVFYKPSFWRMP